MRLTQLRTLLAMCALLMAVLGHAIGTLAVTSPTAGSYLGRSNTITFNITGATTQVKVSATATGPNGVSFSAGSVNVTPDSDGKASGSLSLPFTQSAPAGTYSIVVSASEGGVAYTPVTISVTVDVVAPKFIELSPVSGGYTKGIIHIRAKIDESNPDTWLVQVNGENIPNGSGEGNIIDVVYDATGLPADGSQNITIKATDKASNSTSKTISLTLDRVAPTVKIVYPLSNTVVRKGQDVSVIVDVTDASTTSVDKNGVDVIATRPDGTFVARVTLVSFRASGSTTQRWTGRLRNIPGGLPKNFLITANAVDRAGNAAAVQQVTVRYGG